MAYPVNTAVHVRYNGRSEELGLTALDLQDTATDIQIKQAVERHLDLPASSLDHHIVVRTSQAIIVRPQAIYG